MMNNLPKYSQPRHALYDTLPLEAPFSIQGQTAHIFPLRANLYTLQMFVDGYANIIPPELGYFRAFLPYVQLMVLDYGALKLNVANLGFLSQYETMFTIPVEWYRRENGQLVFHDYAWLTPFIFVDSELSFKFGRTEQGWPKGFATWLPLTAKNWMYDPRSPSSVAIVGSKVFSENYRGKPLELQPILEVVRRPPPTPFTWPMNAKNPYVPWDSVGNLASAMQSFSRDYLGVLDGLGIMPGHVGATIPNFSRMALTSAAMINPLKPNLYFNTINLKQFRDANSTKNYCYQSLTNGKLRIASWYAGGLLADPTMLAGDMTGGYAIRLNRWPSLPIIETLGLEVAREWRGDGVDVAELNPVAPFYYTVDMTYSCTTNIAWRTVDRIWHDQQGNVYPPNGGVTSDNEALYNTTLGLYTQEMTGPYEMSGTVRVLPLLAKKSVVQSFLDSCYNVPMNIETPNPIHWRFDVWGTPDPRDDYVYVYLVATSYESVTSLSNNVGDWASEDVTFMVPVQLRQLVGDEWAVRSSGLVPAFTFVDNAITTVTISEVQGVPSSLSTIIHPPSSWMTNNIGTQKLLEISTEVVPATDIGQQAIQRVILEISSGEVIEKTSEPDGLHVATQWASLFSREVNANWGTREAFENDFQNQLALSIEPIMAGIPLNIYTLKQFRDTYCPDNAAYQAIVRTPIKVCHLRDLREAEEPMHVKIREYPSQPIVTLLGLVATLAHEQDGGVVYDLRPVRPFWLKMEWFQELGQNLWFRSGSKTWRAGDQLPAYCAEVSNFVPHVGPTLVDFVDDMLDEGIAAAFYACQQYMANSRDPLIMSAETATSAMKHIEPQMILDAMLSREWGNADPNNRWRTCRAHLTKRIDNIFASCIAEDEAWAATVEFFRTKLGEISPYVSQRHACQTLALFAHTVQATADIVFAVMNASAPKAPTKFGEGMKLIMALSPDEYDFPDDRVEIEMLRSGIQSIISIDGADQFWADSVKQPDKFVALVQMLRASRLRQKNEVIEEFAKALALKPDFCVPRAIARTDSVKNQFLPLSKSWDEHWYAGNGLLSKGGKP
ncbi:MAG TPA: hypothetical protein PK156_15035 [Polyangium sp.]|nr:hypothetical protein [Polyangium sp.]